MENTVLNSIVSELLSRSGSGAAVHIESFFPGGRLVGGKYTLRTHSVTMYTEVIKQQCLQLFGSLERVYDYFKVVLAHELGHATDTYLVPLSRELDGAEGGRRSQVALKIEENAWENAMEWIHDVDPVFIDVIVDQSLAAYREVVHSETA
ncbi:hypothetical protein M3231_08820 [Neobacillus mesonae]|nr:hypothetical protein [Neobacillus mesonae]